MSNRAKFVLLFLFLVAFRTAFGLSQPFFAADEVQTYLIGLKYFTTGNWPYFGPDLIVTETGFYTQIPGALEGLLIGLPFRMLPIPEAPFIFLNLLSTSTLALLAWYISLRVRNISLFFIFAWLALLPWNLHESANTINPSYLLVGGILFFLGFLESLPNISLNWLSPGLAFAFMGFGLFWNMQFHYSWVLLPPFIAVALFWRWRLKNLRLVRCLIGFAVGSTFPLAFLLPTLIKFGFSQGASGMGLSVAFNWNNFLAFFTVLARFFSLPSFELPRFIGPGTQARIEFFKAVPWLLVPGLFLVLVGWIQPFVLLIAGFFKDEQRPGASAVHRWTLFTLILVWISFWFTSKPPQAHMYYIVLPLLSVYSFYIWDRFAPRKSWRIFAVICLAANLWFEAGYMVVMLKKQSLYLDRARVVKAIDDKDYRILGERRPGSVN